MNKESKKGQKKSESNFVNMENMEEKDNRKIWKNGDEAGMEKKKKYRTGPFETVSIAVLCQHLIHCFTLTVLLTHAHTRLSPVPL